MAGGPESAGITNRLPGEHILLWEVEVRGQGRYRRQGAAAALSRTEWEIAFQEQTLAADVIRAYTALLYRREKLRLLEETLHLNERLVEDIRRLVDLGRLRSADLIVARTEVTDTLDLVAAGREAVEAAGQDLNRSLGVAGGAFEVEGTLEQPAWKWDPQALTDLALARRADLHARQLAVAEANANVRLAVANRYGNPTVGPALSYDPSRVTMIGIQVNVPLPIGNTHRGEIAQSEAERAQAVLLLRQAEYTVRQDVAAALVRLAAAERRAETSRTRALPETRRAVEDLEKLFQAGEPGVDVLKVIDARRKYLRARDSYLDALWSVRQARIDVSAAAGEPALSITGPPPPPAPLGPPHP